MMGLLDKKGIASVILASRKPKSMEVEMLKKEDGKVEKSAVEVGIKDQ